MGSKATPAPPDYTGAAQAQAAASAQNVMTQNYANRPQVNTPFGTQSWQTSAVTDPSTGQQVTQWTQNIGLTPDLQSALQSQIDTQLARSLRLLLRGRSAGAKLSIRADARLHPLRARRLDRHPRPHHRAAPQ